MFECVRGIFIERRWVFFVFGDYGIDSVGRDGVGLVGKVGRYVLGGGLVVF